MHLVGDIHINNILCLNQNILKYFVKVIINAKKRVNLINAIDLLAYQVKISHFQNMKTMDLMN
jgi:hypothetical protein